MAAGIICEYCGGLNDASLTNCSKCGAPLPPPPAPPPSPQQQLQRPVPAPQYRPLPSPVQAPRRAAGKGCAVVGCALLIAMVGGLILIGIIGALMNPTTSTTPRALKTPAPGHDVVSLHGSASTTTRPFEMGREWDLVWSYNCSNLGHNGTFAVVTHLIGAPSTFDDRIDRIGKSDSGRMHARRGGTYTATVTTSCHWAIKTVDHV